jgi:hypothetical protein
MQFTSNATFFPQDGEGAARSVAGPRGTTAAATGSFTEDSLTDSAFNPTAAGVAVGDYVFTTDGYYQSVQSFVAGVGGTITLNGKWRLPRRNQTASTKSFPLTGTAQATIIAGSIDMSQATRVIIDRIVIAHPLDGTLVIGDQRGTAIPGHLYDISATDAPAHIDIGYEVDSPFTITPSVAMGGSVYYRVLR